MVTVDDYIRVRLAHRDGVGIYELARTFHHSKRKIQQILAEAEPAPYPRRPGVDPRPVQAPHRRHPCG
jgi:hypothetical protein